MWRQSSTVVSSGMVGPEATAEGKWSGTSETYKVICVAGAARWASRPPLTAERSLRNVLISRMLSPQVT